MSEEFVLQQALSNYGLANARTRLLQSLWNHVYHVEADDGKQFGLRICPLEFRDKSSLEDELNWLAYITKRSQILVPRPVPNLQGELLTVLSTRQGNRFSCLFEWIEGEEAQKHLTVPVMREIGRFVATLHQIAKESAFPAYHDGFRSNYRYGRTLAAAHREWIEVHQAEIGPSNLKLLHAAIDWLIEGLEQIGETRENFGIIHADLHLGNFLVKDEQVSIIDFDQLGLGHYLYDIADLMVELSENAEQFPTLWASFKAGYQAVMELPFRKESELNLFIVAVNLAFLDWVYNARNPNVRKSKMPFVAANYESIRKLVRSGYS